MLESDTYLIELTGILKRAKKLVIAGSSNSFRSGVFSALMTECKIQELESENPNFVVEDGFVYRAGTKDIVMCPVWKNKVVVPEGAKSLMEHSCIFANMNGEVELPSSMEHVNARAFLRVKFLKLHGSIKNLGKAITLPCVIELENGYRTFIPGNIAGIHRVSRFSGTQKEAEALETEIPQMCRSIIDKCCFLFFQYQEGHPILDSEKSTLKRNSDKLFDYLIQSERKPALELLKTNFLSKQKLESILDSAEEAKDIELAAYVMEAMRKKPKTKRRI